MESLGWIKNGNVDSDNNYSSDNQGVKRLYWATPTEEITFHIPDENLTQLGCTIPLLWYQRSSHSYNNLLEKLFEDKNITVCIVVIPFKDGSDLNRICIEVKKDVSIRHILQKCGPLTHDSLVNSGSMAVLLRRTCMSIGIHLRQFMNTKKPTASRRHAIESLCINYKARGMNATDNFYKHFFMDM